MERFEFDGSGGQPSANRDQGGMSLTGMSFLGPRVRIFDTQPAVVLFWESCETHWIQDLAGRCRMAGVRLEGSAGVRLEGPS